MNKEDKILAKKLDELILQIKLSKKATHDEVLNFYGALKVLDKSFNRDSLMVAFMSLSKRRKAALAKHLSKLIESYLTVMQDIDNFILNILKKTDISDPLKADLSIYGMNKVDITNRVISILGGLRSLCKKESN